MNKFAVFFLAFSFILPLSAIAGGETIEIKLVVLRSQEGTRVFFHIPEDLENPNVDTQNFPDTPLLNTVLTQRDYHAAMQLLNHPRINVNFAEWRISAMCKGQPSGITPLIAAAAGARSPTPLSDLEAVQWAMAGRDPSTFPRPIDVIRRLLELGADARLAAGDGFTALHAAVNNSHITAEEKLAIIRLLLEGGADRNAVWGQYGTAAELALRLELDRIQPEVYAALKHTPIDPNPTAHDNNAPAPFVGGFFTRLFGSSSNS